MSNSSVPANAPSWAVARYSQDEATSLSQSHSSTVSYTVLVQIFKTCKFRG